jgi:glutathione S-transferase
MTLYSMNPSNCASKCRLAIYEKDAAVEIVPIPGGDLKSAEYLKIYPLGETPSLEVDGEIIGESDVMHEHLEETFPEKPLLPKSAEARARARAQERPTVQKLLGEQQRALMEMQQRQGR